MESEKLQYIETLLRKREEIFLGGSYNLIIHCILNTINLNELIDFYLPLSDSELKKSIESNIFKRVKIVQQPDKLYGRLFGLLKNTSYFPRQRIRKILVNLLPLLGNIYRKDFFNIFYNSKYYNDILSALSISGEIWDNTLSNLILTDYLKTKKEIYLITFLKYGTIEYSLPYLKNIWLIEPSNYLKIDIIRRISKKHFAKIDFIRQDEPEKYLLAMSLADDHFDDKTLIDCFNDIAEDLKPFGLLSLSQLNKWALIEKEIKKYVR